MRPLEKLPEPDTSQSIQQDLDRPTAVQIYQQVSRIAKGELSRPNKALALSGLVGGLTMGLTALAVSTVTAALGHGATALFTAYLLYPLGFMAVILGRGPKQ